MTRLVAGDVQILLAIKSNNLLKRFVGAIDVLVFDIQDGIDPVRFQERAKPILKAKAGEQTPLMPGMLPIDVEFCCPPSPRSIFEFIQSAQECVETVHLP